MKVNLKKNGLTIEDIEEEKIYVGGEKYLYFITKLYIDNIIKKENLRYACISLNGNNTVIFETKEELWETIGKFNLRKADLEINEI